MIERPDRAGRSGQSRRKVWRASVTPLASIFGSGFLIIVPILERTLGALAVVGMAAVCGLAWLVGGAIRHNVAVAGRRDAGGRPDAVVRHVERASDLTIVVAYVISVALYLRILAQFVVDYASSGSGVAERIVAVAIVGVITAVGLIRGLSWAAATRARGAQRGARARRGDRCDVCRQRCRPARGPRHRPATCARQRADLRSARPGWDRHHITVQGFETVRYLVGVDPATRIAASRVAQITSSIVYVLLVSLATPLMGLGTSHGADGDLLELVRRVAPLLALPLVLCAALSQFSAATADTEAGVGNLRVPAGRR